MTIRADFLHCIASRLNRDIRYVPYPKFEFSNLSKGIEVDKLTDDELFSLFIDRSQQAGNQFCLTNRNKLPETLNGLCKKYGSPSVISNLSDTSISALNSNPLYCDFTSMLTPSSRECDKNNLTQIKTGIVFARYGLAESGSVVLFTSQEQARSYSLLPETIIFLIKKSSIILSMTELAQQLDLLSDCEDGLPSCINIISSPSCTSDIELIKVTGVHGPINSVYVVIEDA